MKQKNTFTLVILLFVLTLSGQKTDQNLFWEQQSTTPQLSKRAREKEPFKITKPKSDMLITDDLIFLLDSFVTYIFTNDSDSLLNLKGVYSYNSDGSQTSFVRYERDDIVDKWIENKYEYNYNSKGMLISEEGYNWESGSELWCLR